MKALSVVYPAGNRIASGRKTLEIRSWQPEPALSPDEDLLIVQNTRYLYEEGDVDPDGRAVAVVRVRAIYPFTPEHMEASCASRFVEGYLAWELTDVRPIESTQPVLAARGIYEVEFEV